MATVASNRKGSVKRVRNPIVRWVLIAVGVASVAIGTVGIFVPILPTTPFLLLAAACFIYSSERMYAWLLGNRLFGRYLKDYIERKGVPLRIKVGTMVFLWGTILASTLFFTDSLFVRILLILIATSVTVHLVWIKTKE